MEPAGGIHQPDVQRVVGDFSELSSQLDEGGVASWNRGWMLLDPERRCLDRCFRQFEPPEDLLLDGDRVLVELGLAGGDDLLPFRERSERHGCPQRDEQHGDERADTERLYAICFHLLPVYAICDRPAMLSSVAGVCSNQSAMPDGDHADGANRG